MVQADQLRAILALHRQNLIAMEYYGREAVKFSLLTGDRNLDLLQQGVNGARALGSQKRRQEAIDAYWKGRGQWPNETRVRELADLFVN